MLFSVCSWTSRIEFETLNMDESQSAPVMYGDGGAAERVSDRSSNIPAEALQKGHTRFQQGPHLLISVHLDDVDLFFVASEACRWWSDEWVVPQSRVKLGRGTGVCR